MAATIDTTVSGDDKHERHHAPLFPVNYAQFYLLDFNTERTVEPGIRAPGESSAGILRTVRGGAFLATGLAQGAIDLAVELHHCEPQPLDGFEDIVEASFQADTDKVSVASWYSNRYIHLVLPAGAGWYRLRYHARGMDEAHDLQSDEPIDCFALQIWPAPPSDVATITVTSRQARHWLSR